MRTAPLWPMSCCTSAMSRESRLYKAVYYNPCPVYISQHTQIVHMLGSDTVESAGTFDKQLLCAVELLQ